MREDLQNLKEAQEGINIEFNTYSAKQKKPKASEIDTLRQRIEAAENAVKVLQSNNKS